MKRYTLNDLTKDTRTKLYNRLLVNHNLTNSLDNQTAFSNAISKLSLRANKSTTLKLEGQLIEITK